MKKNRPSSSGRDDLDLKALIRRAGLKLTPQRLEILRLLLAADFHPDAETIFLAVRKRIPSVSRDTVYRNLRTLVDRGLAGSLNTSRGAQHFEGTLVPHHHFLCTRCGLIRDFFCPDFDRLQAPEAVRNWGRIHKVQVELTGLCESCSRIIKTKGE